MNPLSLIIIPYNRIIFLLTEPRRIRLLNQTIKTIRSEHKRTQDMGMVHYERIYNVSLYLLIFEYDMATLKSYSLFAFSKWKKGFIARQFAILLYEISQKLPKLLGKDFLESLELIDVGKKDSEAFKLTTKRLNNFKNKNRTNLQKLRNEVGAHRDFDAVEQIRTIEKVDLLHMVELSGDFYESIREINHFLITVIERMGDMNITLKHYLNKQEKPTGQHENT